MVFTAHVRVGPRIGRRVGNSDIYGPRTCRSRFRSASAWLVTGKLTRLHLELTPFAFELIAIQDRSFCLVFGGLILHAFFCTCEVLGK
jgi:hypothetical protein